MTTHDPVPPARSRAGHARADLAAIPVGRSGVCVVDGYGIRLQVERGRLVISDGAGPQRRESRFVRATCPIRRLVVVGHTGFFTLDALRWLSDVGVGFMHLDRDGRVLETSANFGSNDSRLRRAQALAAGTRHGHAISRGLLLQKLDGQARVVGRLPRGGAVAAEIRRVKAHLSEAGSAPELMTIEAAAANAYWQAWSEVAVQWVRNDAHKVPDLWRSVGPRTSPLTGSPRLAATPAHAIFNYLYAILEAEARLGCLAVGLDPGLGVLHADQRGRDSLALDVLEAVRPEVDAYVFELLRRSVFRADDFLETRQGVSRILPPLTYDLADTTPQWAKLLAPVVERVANAFADSPGSRVARLPSRLTQANRSAGRDHMRRRPRPVAKDKQRKLDRSICRGCGVGVTTDQAWCDSCRPDVKLKAAIAGLARARALRARLRVRGHDPATSDAARAKLSDTLRRRRAEESAWDAGNPHASDPGVFRLKVLPLIQDVPVRRLASRTGLSVGYCALVRRGLRTPHERWWDIFKSAPDR